MMVLQWLTRVSQEVEGLSEMKLEKWVKGYARAIGITTSVAVELWALRDGIQLCIALKLPAVEIELDAKVVVDLESV